MHVEMFQTASIMQICNQDNSQEKSEIVTKAKRFLLTASILAVIQNGRFRQMIAMPSLNQMNNFGNS